MLLQRGREDGVATRYLLHGAATKRPLINSAVSLASPFRDFASFAAIGPAKLFIIARFRVLSISLTATVTTVYFETLLISRDSVRERAQQRPCLTRRHAHTRTHTE